MTLRKRSTDILVERFRQQFASRAPKRVSLIDPPQRTIGWDALAFQDARFDPFQVDFWARLTYGPVHVTRYECHIGNVVCYAPLALWELGARQDVVPLNITLKKNLATRVEVKNAPVHTCDVQCQ